MKTSKSVGGYLYNIDMQHPPPLKDNDSHVWTHVGIPNFAWQKVNAWLDPSNLQIPIHGAWAACGCALILQMPSLQKKSPFG